MACLSWEKSLNAKMDLWLQRVGLDGFCQVLFALKEGEIPEHCAIASKGIPNKN